MSITLTPAGSKLRRLTAHAYRVPTEAVESDGTLEWSATDVVVAEAETGGTTGLGYAYGDRVAADVIVRVLSLAIADADVMDLPRAHATMQRAVRNIGRPGIASTAVAAVDTALWDAKARLLGVSLLTLIGASRDAVAVYGSGGFTSYSVAQLQKQLAAWASAGMQMVKMKIGRDEAHDRDRVARARDAIGPNVELFVDANGAYDRTQAARQAMAFARQDVRWFEEPVSSDDLAGLRLLRERAPTGMAIAAGEYGYDPWYFRRMLDAGAVDVLQADATRCGGISGFLEAAAICDAYQIPLSAHTAPHLHAYLCCAVPRACHVEYFHDHARIEPLFFDGALQPSGGFLLPDRSRPGLGIDLRRQDIERFAV